MVALRPILEPAPVSVTRCAHCQSAVPLGLIRAEAERQFCCSGCETVYEILHSKGLTEYYARRGETKSQPAKTTARTYCDFDDPTFLAKHSQTRGPGRQHVELYLEGVHCGACLWLVEKVLKNEEGVIDARLDLGRSTVSIDWNPAQNELSSLGRELDRLGYPPHPAANHDRRATRRAEDRRLLIRIAVAGACFGNAMLMAFALYGGLFSGIELEFSQMFRWGSMLTLLPSVTYAAAPFFRGAANSLRARVPNMDLPIAVGLSLGTIAGVVNTVRGAGEIYFDSLTALIFLLLAGRWLQSKQQRRAMDAAELLYSLAPASARVIEPSGVREVPAENVLPGTRLEVRPSETIPADGVIESGSSSLDLSILTGESRPVEVSAGSPVSAGTLNVSGTIVVIAEVSGAKSRLGRLMKLVDEAELHRAPIVLEADKLAAKFVVRVLALAVLTLVAWLFIQPGEAIDHTIALLVVSCPCALALATPLAVSAAIGQAARVGIFIKGGDTLERLAKQATLWFDKTGTLTEGAQVVVEQVGLLEDLTRAGILALSTAHPVSKAIARAFAPHAALAPPDVQQTLGGGIQGTVQGRRIALGSAKYLRELGLQPGLEAEATRAGWAKRGLTPVLIGDLERSEVIALVAVADELRADAKVSIERLRAMGYSPGVLSGDDPVVVKEIAAALGIPEENARGSVTPESKLRTIAETKGPVIMVGDGANDAAALSRADVGIAVFGGTEASLSAAHVFTRRPGLAPVVEAIDGSRRTLAVIRRNMRISLFYNLVGVSLAGFGLIGPLGAAILMPLSSLTVVLFSYRSRMFGRRS